MHAQYLVKVDNSYNNIITKVDLIAIIIIMIPVIQSAREIHCSVS